MRNRALQIFLAVILTTLGACAAKSNRTELIGTTAPYTKFNLLDGSFLTVEELRGKTAVITFWATWCSESRKCMNRLNAFADKFRGRSDYVFLTASIDKADKFDAVKERVIYTKLDNMKHAFSGNDVYDEAYMSFHGDNLPYFVVLDPQGVIKYAGNDDDGVYEALGVDPGSVPSVKLP
ncbi:MAG: TlpA family protein disulfide reductase [Oligoflexia bacterium]|nr:TlpA family protein disulfide reductase [Oligoflexia bacterium]